ncbi:MAG: hypothetical protein GY796_06925, partial [Chloroflexi bacterium]|nr:hypothetical protein [Chloroflexota bacterium]
MNNYKNIQSSSSSALQQRAVQKTKRFGMISLVPILAVMGLMLLFWHISPIASLTLAPTTPLAPIFRHVAANGSGTVCSVDNPCPLQTAVSQSADGDEVRVAAGNYSIGNPVLFVTQSITIAGGYTTTNRFQVQDPLLNSTVLNGNNTKGVIEIDNNASPIIEGFRIRNGNSSNGAGIYILDSTGTGFGDPSTGHPIIQNNWIQNNSASFGSAIFVGSLNVTIENNEISNNSATAGAIWLLFGNTILNLKPHADILFNNIHDNTASGSNGGGIFVSSNSSIFAEGNEIYNNSGNSGGGVYIKDDGTATMQNNMVYQNTASIGGGVYTFGNLESWNNTFAGNVASAGVGGGIFIANIATIQISNTIVASNTATSGESGINLSAGGTISGGGYNNYFNNSSNVIFGTDFITNPGFINYSTMNLHLRLGSDNVDAADSNTSPAINQDIDKQARPNGAFVDVGADEFYANIPDFSLTPLEILPYPYEDRSATAVYTHTLENQGTIDDTYTFTCSNSLGWTVTCPSSQSLQVGASLVVPTSVDIPAVATALSKGVTQITATSTISPLLHKRVSVSSIVQPIPGIQFTPNYTDSVKPGDIITLTHTITNLGDAPDTFNVTINSDPLGWGQIVPNDPLTVPLGIGGVANIQVQINVPPDSASQLANVTEIQAASSYDVNIFATVYNTVTARETAGTRYVRADGTDTNNNCTQVSNPCLTASQAISQAITLDEIRIAAGTYDQNGEIDINETLFVSGRWLGNFSKQEPFIDTTLRQVGNERIFNIQGGISNQSTFDNLILKDGIESAANGGAVFVGNGVQVGFSNITIQTSQANNGGAMVIGQNAFARITKGEFLTNTASIHGGGIYVDGGTLILKQSIFEGNQATGANGGGVYIKDGLFTAENTLYNDNSADNGGGLYIDQTPATLNFNTFVNNASSTQGGGIYADNANGIAVDVLNTILVSNTANTDGGAIYSTNSISPVVNLDYTNIWNNSAPELVNIGTNSNPFTLPPQFDDKQFRLAVGSPLVDQLARGTSQIVPQPVVDFEDDFRPSDQGYDLGYDELAGCSAKRDNVIYGSIQEAIDVVNPQSDLILVSGICRGVNQMVDVNGQTISQTVHITGSQSLIIQGGWLGDFSNRRVDETTLLDPELKGRALYISSPVSVTFEFFTFVNGQAAGLGGGPAGEDAGGSVYNNGGNLTLDAISIYTGTAELGGAVYHHDGFTNFGLKNPANATNFLIDQNQVGTILLGEMWANTAAADGGALYVYSNTVAVDSVYIHNNTAVNGAGIYNDNGVLTATNNILSINDASNDGGAIYNASPYTTTLLHLTVVTNTAVNDGGGIYYPGGALSVTIQSNIFEGNSITSGSGEAIFAPGTADVDYNYYYGQSNPVAGGTTTGTHSINTLTIPPGLIDPANGDFHLQNDAPAADVGNPASPVNHDIDDEPRPSNQGPDAGADELVGCRVDLNGTLYGSIQTAMQNAQTGDTLKVAGRCSGVHDYDTGNTSGLGCADTSGIIQTTVHVDQNIILKGGWSDDFGTWDPLLFPTTLDARQLGRVLYFSPGVTATVEHFHIIQGFISNNGAGVCIDNATPKLNNNYIYSNTANTGGGMYSYDSKAQIDGNWIHHNNAINGAGIAAAVSGSVSAGDSIWNNFVYSNTATLGGGYYNESGDHNFWHNTLVGNAATSNGGAAYANAASPDIRSNIFYNNSSSGTDGVHGGVGSTPTVEFNDFFGQTSNVGGTIGSLDPSNLTVDPLFNTSTYTLTIHSPVVDQGDPGVTLTYDFEGDIRMSHQGFDIGADEIGGCFAIIQGQPTPVYGSVQQAVDLAVSGDTVLVDGVCKRTNTRTNSSSDTVTQTLFIDKQLTVDGSWEYPLDPETHLSATLNALIYGRVLYVDSSGSVTLTNITLKNGDATLAGLGNNGGGAYNDGDLIVLNARLQSNLAGNGGAIYNNANLTSIHSRIVNNLATNGGGIYNEATAVITSVNSIVFNSATGNGGGIFQNNGDIIVDSNRIAVNNTATGDGGGLYLAGGTGNNVEIRNNFIYRNNAANNGGGLHNADTDASIWHNTFRINQAGSGFGGGLYSADRTALITIRSNIIDLNTGSGIHTDGPHDIAFNNVVNNIIDNYSGTASAGTGDISATPMYEDVLADDYHLKKLSPGLDVADPNVPFVHDIDGDIRPTNGGPDMGADELNSCLIRVIDTQDSSHHIFAVLQRAIDFAEGLPAFPIPTIEIARGECSGVEADSQNGGSLQVGAVHQDLNLIGSLDRDDFSFTNDYHRDDVDTVSSVINAEGLGRVLQVHNNANIFIKNLAFVGGDATLSGNGTNGGGIHNADSSINADETFICANTADNGGGYYGGSSSYSDLSGFLMGRCMTADVVENSNGTLNVNYFIHSGNNANADGGGMYSAGDFDLRNIIFWDNDAGQDGGGLFNSQLGNRIINGIFYLNTATGDGGGIQNSGSSLSLYHNTYRGNTAANGTGGAINNNSTGLTLNSSILFTNTASIDGGGLNSSSGAALSHNLYYDNLPNDVNSGGLGSNPIIKNPRLYLFSLSRYSPAIDQADPLNLNPGVPAPGGQTIIDYDVGNYFR